MRLWKTVFVILSGLVIGLLFPRLLDTAFAAAIRNSVFVRLSLLKHPACSLMDVVRAERNGLNPVDPSVAAAIRVIKTEGALKLADSPSGPFWIPARDIHTLSQMLTEQNGDVYTVDGRGVRLGDTVLDCGANVGVFTRHALSRGARRVIAIDPAPEAVECLRRSFASEISGGSVVVIPKGVWNERGSLDFVIDSQSWSSHVAIGPGPRQQTIKVPLTTIDSIVAELKLDRVDFIKMDIEGAERQALRGAQSTVAKFRPRMAIALEHLKNDAEEIPALIHALWPGMHTICGPCNMESPSGIYRVQPKVVVASTSAPPYRSGSLRISAAAVRFVYAFHSSPQNLSQGDAL